MNETGCIICGAPLVYMEEDELLRCAICHKKVRSKVKCRNGHFVCDSCHMQGLDGIVGTCMTEQSKDPVVIMEHLMDLPFCHMHGPEHHTMVGAALLTAYRNAGGQVDLMRALAEMIRRGREVPGGICGYWGACGAAISTGIYISILTGSSPLSEEPFRLSNLMTSAALKAIGTIGGPRCCKRDSYLSLLAAIDFTAENLGIQMDSHDILWSRMKMNDACIGKRCPFLPRHTEAENRG